MGILRKLLGLLTVEQRGAEVRAMQRRPLSVDTSVSSGAAFERRDIDELLYPEELPTFEELEAAGHTDLRAVAYTILCLDTQKKRPFHETELRALDFGKSRAAYSLLLKKGLIEKLSPAEELAAIFTKDELAAMLTERGLPTSGKKRAVAERLVDSGYKLDRRKHRGLMFRLTERGKDLIARRRLDGQQATSDAISALKERDYAGAVSAYRALDRAWGFTHTSGKRHTIFAHYDVPPGRFAFYEQYQMRELCNSQNFKDTLRACLLAGLMRGEQESWGLRKDFEAVCAEKINCPNLLRLFDYERPVLEEMQRQIACDPGNALEYYISHVLYLCRRWE